MKLNSLNQNGKIFPLPHSSNDLKQSSEINLKKEKKEPLEKVNSKELAYDEKLKDVSRLYEKHFLRELVKAMRKTVPESSLTKPSMSERIYKKKMDEEYVEKWGDHESFGLSKIIYKNIKERLGHAPSLYQPQNAPKGKIKK